jgi:putative oxidoreductase
MNEEGTFQYVWAPRLLSLLRIVVGLLFLHHGSQKLFGFPVATPQPIPAFSLPWVGGILEFFGGILILIGLLTRPVAFILSGEMAVAYFMAHAPTSFFPLVNHGELAVLYCFVFLYFAVAGGGPWSVDHVLRSHAST